MGYHCCPDGQARGNINHRITSPRHHCLLKKINQGTTVCRTINYPQSSHRALENAIAIFWAS
ncbi:hypothetical protein [Moorena producens]|uniref:hypothetical protein n=1 Tax=Moorena producens TaxID=1155739 RepID=UPI0011EA6813|nr:hypothetical protein [Moorena producens]